MEDLHTQIAPRLTAPWGASPAALEEEVLVSGRVGGCLSDLTGEGDVLLSESQSESMEQGGMEYNQSYQYHFDQSPSLVVGSP